MLGRDSAFRRFPNVVAGAALLGLAVGAAPPPEPGAGVVAADHELASAAGAELLSVGGNAVDAAVAAALAAGVVQPAGSGLGGGGFAVGHLSGETWALDFREVGPAGAHRDLYLGEDGAVVPGLSRKGGLAVGVPGESRGLAQLVRDHGATSHAKVAAPAIRLATKGFRVRPHLGHALEGTKDQEVLDLFPGAAVGKVVTNPNLARTLRKWAATRGEDLYTGAGAEAVVAATTRTGGILTADDLAGYAPVAREPVTFTYRGHTVHTMPLPSSGGVVLGQMLRVLEGYDIQSLGWGSSELYHLLAEVMKHAYADRAQHLGDPDFVEVDTARLVSDERVAEIRQKIWPMRTHPPEYYGALVEPPQDAGTQHISVIDAQGGAVALTTTINTSFGSGVVAGTGFPLNNEMDDFAAAPGVPNAYGLVGNEANAVAAGKRPLSSMTPTLLRDAEGEVVLAVGGSGGPFIISGTLQAILGVVDFGLTPAEAVAAPRVHHQWMPNRLFIEPDVPVDVRQGLEARGHELDVRPGFSSIQAVQSRDGLRYGAADPRKGGRAEAAW
ncbi:MAG: gamma-glutamyltransferase [Deltaproteobacteria bacterium]|nr:MAG: gamma-glutamyltransferase [Deltaproteobacteria bacterium]